MKKGWKVKKLGEVCEKITDGTHSTPTYLAEGIPFLSVKNLTSGFIDFSDTRFISVEEHKFLTKRCRPEKEDILYTKVGTTGIAKVVDVNREFSIFVSVALLKIKHDIVFNNYLEYFLNSPFAREQAKKRTRGMANKNLVIMDIKEIIIYYPKSIPEQQRIVAILDEAFDSIAKAKENAEKNLQNARELFESYLNGLFLNSNENWEMKKWGELCDFVRGPFGGSLKKSVFKEKGYVVYEQKHAIHDHFNQLRYFIDEDKFNEMIRFEVKPGDLIMSCSGVTLGRVAIVPDGIPRGIINQALLKLTPKKGVSAHFLKHWLRSKIFQDIIFKYSGGAAIPNVPSAKILKDIKIPFPKIEEQNIIVNEIEIVSTETKKLEAIYSQKLNDLEELKKSILQKAFNGEL